MRVSHSASQLSFARDRNGDLYEDREEVEEDEQDSWAGIYLSAIIGRWKCRPCLVSICAKLLHCLAQPATRSTLNLNRVAQNPSHAVTSTKLFEKVSMLEGKFKAYNLSCSEPLLFKTRWVFVFSPCGYRARPIGMLVPNITTGITEGVKSPALHQLNNAARS